MDGDQAKQGGSSNVLKIKLLARVALADGKWDPREITFLEFLAAKFGVSRDQLEELKSNPDMTVDELAAGLPTDNAERIDFLADLIRVAHADREVHDRELDLLVRVGRALGFQADEVIAIVEEM
ncbi:MAG: TerB family tellurite resistance protein [Planctomycetota bacterium]|jgi:uncharacterized tellurite resistance protein B-like protein